VIRRREALVRTAVSEELIAYIIRVERFLLEAEYTSDPYSSWKDFENWNKILPNRESNLPQNKQI
jgi:hypothetical protein